MSLVQKCVNLLKQQEFKKEMNAVIQPIMDIIMEIIRPYFIWVVLFIILQTTIQILSIYVLLKILRLKL